VAVVRSRLEFGYEHEMVEPARNWLLGQGLMVKEEFPVPWGICDLVACQLDPEKVESRLALGQRRPIGSLLRISLLTHLPDADRTSRGATLRHLAKVVGPYVDESRLEEELGKLAALKHVQRTRSGSYQRLNGWWPLHSRLLAIELKISRVPEAIAQARSHKAFTRESYIGLPMEKAEGVMANGMGDTCHEAGIGLLGVANSGCAVLISGERDSHSPDPVLEMHAVERFWRPYLKGSAA
jgi:hypothetical protein